MKAIIVPALGGPKVVDFEMGESYDLIQSTVDGIFDCVRINSLGVDVWIHDEGKIIGLPVNALATMLWFHEYGLTDVLAGDVLITGGVNDEGETLGLTDAEVDTIINTMYSMNNAMVLKFALSESMRMQESYA